jgi:glutamyl-tRNA(Gln) amidotransferase subunit E
MDFRKLGLKCGIEIHQQLDTKKLFCNCETSMEEKPDTNIVRRLRAVAGELGQVDAAAMHEFLRGREFDYKNYPSESCLVEADEEPPHGLDMEALDISLMVSRMLNCDIPDEIHVMRKAVIDGSNTGGFQRTAMVGLNGYLKTRSGRVGITNISVEEDASQILSKIEGRIHFGLNRLGIPLVEIGTDPDIKSPEHAREVAAHIGMVLRSTGKVKRGLGTIRQDVNISIKGGARIEIKGAQDLKLIPKYIENEASRQLSLINIRKDLKKRGFSPIKQKIVDVTGIFKGAKSPIVRSRKVYAVKLPGFAGIFNTKLTSTRTLGKEMANYVKVKTESKGFIHNEEDLDKYGLEKEFEKLKEKLKASRKDCVAIVSGEKKVCEDALDSLIERINLLLEGVPEETRRALENGDSEYMRPLPGAARLYPETDILPIRIARNMLVEIDRNLPELLEQKIARYRKLGLNEELSRQVVQSGRWSVFEHGVGRGMKPVFIASFLTSGLTQLKRKEGLDVEGLSDSRLLDILGLVKSGSVNQDALGDIVRKALRDKEKPVSELIGRSDAFSQSDLKGIIRKVIEKNRDVLSRERPEKILMGEVMKEIRGRVPGNLVMKALVEELKKA